MRLDFPSTDFNIISTRQKVSFIHTLSFLRSGKLTVLLLRDYHFFYESSIKPITNWVAWLHQGKISENQPLSGQDRTTCDARIALTRPSRDLLELRFGNTDNSVVIMQSETRLPLFELAQAVIVDALSCELYPHSHSHSLPRTHLAALGEWVRTDTAGREH